MAKTDAGLLRELERDALGSGALADALRRCMVLGGKAGSPELREWAVKELRGYDVADELPGYRQVPALICVDATNLRWHVTAHPIAPSALPDVVQEHVSELVPVRFGIGEIEAMVSGRRSKQEGAVKLGLPHGGDVCRLMNHEIGDSYQQIHRIYWNVSASALEGVIDQVRTTLAELVSEITAGLPPGEDLPTREMATQALNVAVHGMGNRVSLTAPQAAGASTSTVAAQEPGGGFWTLQRRIAAFIAGSASVLGALLATHQVWGWPF